MRWLRRLQRWNAWNALRGLSMPLKLECSAEAFRENIAAEIADGKTREQAFAIAMTTLQEACRREGKELPSV